MSKVGGDTGTVRVDVSEMRVDMSEMSVNTNEGMGNVCVYEFHL